MMRPAAILVAAAAALAACATAPPERPGSRLQLIDLTDDFAEVWDRTRNLDEAARIAAFKAHFEPIIPGFYSHQRHRAPEERFNAYFAKALREFPETRAPTAEMAGLFAALLLPAERSFEREFGPLTGFPPIYLVNSLGEFDGGMRTLGGKGYLMFGPDVMARIYAGKDIRPFFHHEMFHLHHSRTFRDCSKLWCNLWSEGLATYVAHRLNPAATDAELLLTEPEPLRRAVEDNRHEAVCTALAGLDSEEDRLNKALFSSGRLNPRLPGRFGYYVGYLVAERAGKTRSPVELANLPNEAVRPLVESSLRALESCPA
jgi:hypothetical protein